MFVIGLTGGIASGKSVVARRLAGRGAVHVDADALAREVVEPGTPALASIAERFGPGVISTDGRLDRAALGAIIFADQVARQDLNDITHPAIWRRASELFTEASAADPGAIVVYDVPLLVEASQSRPLNFDTVVVVEADDEERVRRLVQLRGMTADDARRRLASQATNAERRAVADVVINTNGSLAQTHAQVDALWESIAHPTNPAP